MIVWHEWPLNGEGLPAGRGENVVEVHIVPECERRRHRPQLCWCDPILDVCRPDSIPRFRHKVRTT